MCYCNIQRHKRFKVNHNFFTKICLHICVLNVLCGTPSAWWKFGISRIKVESTFLTFFIDFHGIMWYRGHDIQKTIRNVILFEYVKYELFVDLIIILMQKRFTAKKKVMIRLWNINITQSHKWLCFQQTDAFCKIKRYRNF